MNDEKKKVVRAAAEEITKRLGEQGKLVEGGWRAFMLLTDLDKASEVQRNEMRKAYYAGCQHLFSSIMTIMDPGEEPTEADLRKMDFIHQELEAFVEELKGEIGR